MTQGHRHRYGSAFRSLSLAFALSLLFAIIPLGGAFAQTPEEDEFDGRFENTVELEADGAVEASIEWSQFTFADGSSDTAAVGRSDKFPDNLASSLIQGQEDAPLLLTGNEALDDRVAAELERLGVETVHILGGDAALDETVENELEAAGYTVHRDAGVTRIETAIDIARTHAPNATEGLLVRAFGGPSGDETQAWADALAGGAWAADANMPVFLTQTNELNDNLRAYLEDSDITSLTILGGTAAISEAVRAELEAMGIDVERVAGSNRFATAIAIAEARGFDDPFDAGSVILIEGQAANAWASGFAAAAYADLSNGVVILSNGANLPPETQGYLEGADADNDGVNDNADEFTPDADGDPLLVCGPFVDPEACAAAAAILGFGERTDTAVNASYTDVPELIAAELGRVDEDDDTAIVRFIFDEAIDEDAIDENDFQIDRKSVV
jgi:putative cell wall-binding protein